MATTCVLIGIEMLLTSASVAQVLMVGGWRVGFLPTRKDRGGEKTGHRLLHFRRILLRRIYDLCPWLSLQVLALSLTSNGAGLPSCQLATLSKPILWNCSSILSSHQGLPCPFSLDVTPLIFVLDSFSVVHCTIEKRHRAGRTPRLRELSCQVRTKMNKFFERSQSPVRSWRL